MVYYIHNMCVCVFLRIPVRSQTFSGAFTNNKMEKKKTKQKKKTRYFKPTFKMTAVVKR